MFQEVLTAEKRFVVLTLHLILIVHGVPYCFLLLHVIKKLIISALQRKEHLLFTQQA